MPQPITFCLRPTPGFRLSSSRSLFIGSAWSVSASHSDYGFSADRLTTTRLIVGTTGSQAQANTAQASGYFEIKSNDCAVGLTPSGAANNTWIGFVTNSIGYHPGGTVYKNNVNVATYAAFAVGDVVMVAFKGGKVYFGKNGTWQSGTDPSAGTGGIDVTANFASAVPAISGNDALDVAVARFTNSALSYALPTGLTAWDGTTAQTFTYSPSGGLQTGGSAALLKTKTPVVSGGLQAGGSATLAKIKSAVAAGGLQTGGAASLVKTKSPTASGGAQLGGLAPLAKLKIPTVSGGVQFAGSSALAKSKTYTPSGGAQFAGTAARLKIKTPNSLGGAQFAGASACLFGAASAAFTYQGNGNFTFGGRSTNELDTLVPGLAALDQRLRHTGGSWKEWRRVKRFGR